DGVFQKLGVFLAMDKLVDSLQFVLWFRYADEFIKKNPDYPNLLMPTLMQHNCDDALLAMIEVAMKNPSTLTIAKKLHKEGEMKGTYREVRTSDNTFVDKKISKAIDNLLASDHFQLWRAYLDRFNEMTSNR
ncbi:hypothetical protein PHYSODRAFT_512196, partial [Phytophthora sojae]